MKHKLLGRSGSEQRDSWDDYLDDDNGEGLSWVKQYEGGIKHRHYSPARDVR